MSYFGSCLAFQLGMAALSTPTDEWFVQDLRGPRVQLDDESVAEFRRVSMPKSVKPWMIAAALFGLGLTLLVGAFAGSAPEPAPSVAPAVVVAADEYEADWEAAVEERDPAFTVEKRELPLEPRAR